ncbi:hypothetical protein QT971_06270 [Microcoleus sp. herbarium19]|uniref:hypothetical protein n=1 Tax=Microcoleus sp. herbarium19 TaxID=3055440 RepID=UPI002FD44E0E
MLQDFLVKVQEGTGYDTLTHKKNSKSMKLLFDYRPYYYDPISLIPTVLPQEMVQQIVFETVIQFLQDFHFSDAYKFICMDKKMVSYTYYKFYGTSDVSVLEKMKRLQGTLHLLNDLYRYYMTRTYSNLVRKPCSNLLLYNGRDPFYRPWSFTFETIFHPEEQLGGPPVFFYLGEFSGDIAVFESDHKNIKGVIAFPPIKLVLMDRLQVVKVFKEEDWYYFSRFETLCKVVFGEHCRVFYGEVCATVWVSVYLGADYLETDVFKFTSGVYCMRK